MIKKVEGGWKLKKKNTGRKIVKYVHYFQRRINIQDFFIYLFKHNQSLNYYSNTYCSNQMYSVLNVSENVFKYLN